MVATYLLTGPTSKLKIALAFLGYSDVLGNARQKSAEWNTLAAAAADRLSAGRININSMAVVVV
jgi:hypothetical protein